MKIAIIGRGNVGTALQSGLTRSGHDVQAVGREPNLAPEAAQQADIVVLAIPFAEIDNVVQELGDSVAGKVVVDATNALTPEFDLALGFTTSGAEQLQDKLPQSRIVKAFNTVLASAMDGGRVNGEQLAGLVAADDAEAKEQVLELVEQLGLSPVDAGPLVAARLLEPLAVLNIKLAFVQGYGPSSGFRLAR